MLNRSASLAMSTCVLKALPSKLDIKRREPGILYFSHVQQLCPKQATDMFLNFESRWMPWMRVPAFRDVRRLCCSLSTKTGFFRAIYKTVNSLMVHESCFDYYNIL